MHHVPPVPRQDALDVPPLELVDHELPRPRERQLLLQHLIHELERRPGGPLGRPR